MSKGWQRDGSGLWVFRCRGRTYCPRSGRHDVLSRIANPRAHKRRSRWHDLDGPRPWKVRHQGPAEHAHSKLTERAWRRVRRGLRKRLAEKGIIRMRPLNGDDRYHLRKCFEGREPETSNTTWKGYRRT